MYLRDYTFLNHTLNEFIRFTGHPETETDPYNMFAGRLFSVCCLSSSQELVISYTRFYRLHQLDCSTNLCPPKRGTRTSIKLLSKNHLRQAQRSTRPNPPHRVCITAVSMSHFSFTPPGCLRFSLNPKKISVQNARHFLLRQSRS